MHGYLLYLNVHTYITYFRKQPRGGRAKEEKKKGMERTPLLLLVMYCMYMYM